MTREEQLVLTAKRSSSRPLLKKRTQAGCDERPVEQPVPQMAGESSVVEPGLKNDFYVLYGDIVGCLDYCGSYSS